MSAVQLEIKKKKEREKGHTKCPLFNMNTELPASPMVQYLDGRCSRQSLSETDHAHVISVLFQTASVLVTAVQAGQTQLFVLYPTTRVTTRMSLTAGQLCILLHTSRHRQTVVMLLMELACCLLPLTNTRTAMCFCYLVRSAQILPDSLGLSTHSPLQTTPCHSWCHRSGRHLNCLKQVYLKHKSGPKECTRMIRNGHSFGLTISINTKATRGVRERLPVCSLNSTMAFMVFESANAISQKSLVLPQPSWRSTLMASSSSLNTCKQFDQHNLINAK